MTSLQQELNGPDHEETQGRRGNLGRFLRDQGKLDEAESLYRQNLLAQEVQLGEMHPKTIFTVYSLATILEKKGSIEEASQWKTCFLSFEECWVSFLAVPKESLQSCWPLRDKQYGLD